MKMLKRVFIAALCLAVLISCFAVLASAKEYTTDNFKDILEYYEEPIVLDDNFGAYEEGATYTENVYNNSTGAADMAVVSNGTDKYLKFHSGVTSAPKTKDMFINGNFATPVDDFVFKTTIAGSGDSKTSIKEIIVWIDATTEDVAAFDGEFGTEFININYGASTNEGVVYYYDAATATSVALEGVTINDTDKFEVLLTYNGTKGTYSLTVTSLADANNTATVKDVAAPFKTVSNLKIGSLSASNKANRYVCIYDLALYGGTFVRDNANKQAETEAAINAMYTIYTEENKADGTDVEIAIVAGKLDKYGFTTTDDAVAAKFSELLGIGINIFAEELEKFVAAFDATATYEARVAHVNKYADSAALMPEDLSPAGEEKAARIAELLDAFNTEKTTLDSIKTNSDAFIKALEGADATSTDYGYLRPIYDEAVKYYPGAYDGYTGVPEAKKAYAAIADVVEVLIQNAEGFITSVNEASTETDFATRYAAYVVAKAKYVDNETYPGITEALATFAIINEEMVAIEAKALEFIAYTENANCALYIPAQEAYIALAKAMEGVEPAFPGVAEANAVIVEIETEIANKRAAAAAYIAAVEALEGKTGAELDAAIAEAKTLQAAGNILGIDGVEQANIALSNAESAITNANGFATKFNSLVTGLGAHIVNGKITNSAEARAVILEALEIGAKADDTIAGVSNNRDILNKAITDYNAALKAANDAFAGVCNTAAGVGLSATAKTDIAALVGKVIAFIKELV